ncbi:MAG TPA: HAMP domain-containing sensor histidine kinase [Rhizomicrobium sp.]|nr:HAMP domain-containing sensor histidine kinase [Rhizomicrobium sp.]
MSSFGCTSSFFKPEDESRWNAGRLAEALPPIPAWASCAEVFRILNQADAQRAGAVVDTEGRVVGLVNRLRFLAKYAQRFIPELYDKRPIAALANPNPLVVDEAMPLGELATILTVDRPDALRECFIVAREDRYLGIGTSETLVRAKLSLLTARERQLTEALLAAEAADQTRSNFLALMSHELRTPLNAIIGFSEVLAFEMFGAPQVPRYTDYARDIHSAGRHLLALINDILDLSKSESGHLPLSPEPVDVSIVFRDCLRLLSERAKQGEVGISAECPEALPLLYADALRIKQIVLNVLSNAVKFTEPGGSASVSACVDEDGGITLSVADTGIGMSPEEIPVALEPFRQIDSPLSRNVEGTGLGLSMAKSLTERHGGTLQIESTRGEGTIVRLRFPPERTVPRCHAPAAKTAASM